MKRAVFSIDVEDWYHLDYFDRDECDTEKSLLDGLEVYVELVKSLSIPSSFFVLGEIAETKIEFFRNLVKLGHDIGSHGWNHIRPMAMDLDEFRADLDRSMEVMKRINGQQPFGYRAPCFSLDRERLDIVRECGFAYDSSRIDFGNHPLYGSIDMYGYKNHSPAIFSNDGFMEFEASTVPILGKKIPISGGGYLRIFPWVVMKALINQYLKQHNIYVMYIHPFELSERSVPVVPKSTTAFTKFRYSYGRHTVVDKITKLADLLRSNGYSFTTFSEIQEEFKTKYV